MKSIYNIYESVYEGILSGVEDTLTAGDAAAERFKSFGGMFKFDNCLCFAQANLILKATPLKAIAKGLKYHNDKIENGKFDKQNKFKLFANWLDNLTFDELGLNPHEVGSQEFYTELGKKLTNLCIDKNIANAAKGFRIWVNSKYTNDHEMVLDISNIREAITQYVRIRYIINK